MRKSITFIFYLLIVASLGAQDLSQDFKNWYLFSTNLRFSKTRSVTIGHLSSFDVRGYQHKFVQNKISYNQKFGNQWTGSIAFSHSLIKRKTENLPYYRADIQINHRLKWDHWRMTNSLRLEKYFPQLSKFGARAILSNKFQYYNRKWPLRISPFVRNQLFYYQGGKEIRYFLNEADIDGENGFEEEGFVESAPNGWHRYRFSLGARMRLRPDLYLTFFYTLQKEFNTGLGEFNQLHVPNEAGTSTRLSFNNYSLLGLSLAYTIKFY
ncbi:MAG: hypothetical protein AAFR87_01840 [Bacteroidota bacterium]